MSFFIGIHAAPDVAAACAADLGLRVNDELRRRIVDRGSREVTPPAATTPWVELWADGEEARTMLRCLGAAIDRQPDATMQAAAWRWSEVLDQHVRSTQRTSGIARMWLVNDHQTLPASSIHRVAAASLEPAAFLRLGMDEVLLVHA